MNIEIIGTKIGELRRERELTQDELAKKLGVSAQAVSKWENGGAPDIEMLPTLADFFGVSIDYLFDRAGRKNGEDAPLNKREIFDKIVDLQARMSDERNSMDTVRASLSSIEGMDFYDDDAKREAVENITNSFDNMRTGFHVLIKLYEKMYNDIMEKESLKQKSFDLVSSFVNGRKTEDWEYEAIGSLLDEIRHIEN